VGKHAYTYFVTSGSIMLIAGVAIWLTLILFFVALCRGAAEGDGRGLALTEGYPTASSTGTRASGDLAGLVLFEDRSAPAPQQRLRARDVRARAGQYAARS
jgi:hypothetical protein